MQAAVAGEVGARGKARVISGQPAHDGGDFARLAQAFDRNACHDFFEYIRPDGHDHFGAHIAGADAVDGDAFARQLLRQRHGKAVHARLGGRIVGLPGLAFLAVDGADLDDAPPAFFHHAGYHLAGGIEHAGEIGADDGVPLLPRHLHKGAVSRDACVIDQHIHAAMLLAHALESIDCGLPVGYVANAGVKGKALRGLLIQPLLCVAPGAATCNDFEALAVQLLANGGADAAHAACHVGNFLTHVEVLLYCCGKTARVHSTGAGGT